MKKFLVIIQEAIKMFLFFIIPYIWLAYTLDSSSFAVVLAISISIFLEIVSLLAQKKTKSKKSIKLSKQTNAEKMFLTLIIDKSSINFFYDLFKTRYSHIERKKDYLLIVNHEKEKTLFFPFLKISPLGEDDLLYISKLEKNIDKIIIVCNTFSPSCNQYIPHLDCKVDLLDKYQTYSNIYEEYDFFPQITQQKLAKTSLKAFIKTIFAKHKAKGYILAGLVLLLSSLYVPFSLYYKITSSLLFLFGLVCLLNNENTKKELV